MLACPIMRARASTDTWGSIVTAPTRLTARNVEALDANVAHDLAPVAAIRLQQ